MKPEDVMSKEAVYEAYKATPAEQIELDKMAADIQKALFDFLTNEDPKILHTDDGSEFAKKLFQQSYEIVIDKTALSDEDRKNRVSPSITIIFKNNA